MHPPHIITVLQKWALVTKEKIASLLDHDPTLPRYWSEHPRDKAFRANGNALSSNFTGFSICHDAPIYHENTGDRVFIIKACNSSATLSIEATATFMFVTLE